MKRSPLKIMSKEKARATAKYWPLRRKFLEENQFCYCATDTTLNCPGFRSSQIHHMKGQHFKIMNDTRYWMAVCQHCHRWIEDHKNKAREMGLILYK